MRRGPATHWAMALLGIVAAGLGVVESARPAAAAPLAAPVVGMAGTPSGAGYWLVAADGGVFAFGDATFRGSMGGTRLAQPVVGMAGTPSGAGYWLVAADGGVFSFGDARFQGSTGDVRLVQPVVGLAPTPSGAGYWSVAADGGVFAFGDAPFLGSMGGSTLQRPVVAMAGTPSGAGYRMVGADGGIFAFGDASFSGSAAGTRLTRPVVAIATAGGSGGYRLGAADGSVFAYGTSFLGSVGTPAISVTPVVSGLSIPWDVAFTPDGTMLLTERAGRLVAVVAGQRRVLASPSGTFAQSEAGMMGLAVDPDYASNRRIYVCTAWDEGGAHDVRVQSWTVNGDHTSASIVQAGLVEGLPLTSGRHAGCRLLIGPDGALWIATGDATVGTNPQDLGSLGGKVLRVNRQTGAPVAGDIQGPVYTYGHRNVQGLAIQPGTNRVFAIEQGTARDDEINILRGGGNYGWDPLPGYDESRPMTDLGKFPDAVRPVWTSGPSTIATSGGAFLSGPQWQGWNGQLVVAALKGEQLRLFSFDADGNHTGEQTILSGHGRLRSVTLGPGGGLFVTTSDGGSDQVLRVGAG